MKALFLISILILVTVTTPLYSQTIGIYNGNGVWFDGVVALQHFFEWKGLPATIINSDTLNSPSAINNYDLIIIPGGWSEDYYEDITNRQNIVNYVHNGGAYMGICAGAYFASKTVVWEGETFAKTYGYLFNGKAIGPIAEIAPWDQYAMCPVNIDSTNVFGYTQNSSESILYWGGMNFENSNGQAVDIVARYEINNEPAIIAFQFEQGRVVLFGPHPENEEDSDRDGTHFGSHLNDEGSDWQFLSDAVDWLLGISSTTNTHNNSAITNFKLFQNYPNPFNSITIIRYSLKSNSVVTLSVYDINGSLVTILFKGFKPPGDYSVEWNGQDSNGNFMASGIYFYKISIGNKFILRKAINIK